MKRRTFLGLGLSTLCFPSMSCVVAEGGKKMLPSNPKKTFKISLAQWSLHRHFWGDQGDGLDNLEFAATAKSFGIDAIEYVNVFFKDKAENKNYLIQMKKRAADQGVKSLLIMCDGEGHLGDPDNKKRTTAIENHFKWVEAARFLGCHSIRVNAYSEGSFSNQLNYAADGLARLSDFALAYDINIIVENHGGLSSKAKWLVAVMDKVGMKNCGTLPDFGNFPESENRYQAVKMMMPYAKAVSAKSYNFNKAGSETKIDYAKMMNIVLTSGYHGYVGIEYEGDQLNEKEGILATKNLLLSI